MFLREEIDKIYSRLLDLIYPDYFDRSIGIGWI
jgi:hypothetical protein